MNTENANLEEVYWKFMFQTESVLLVISLRFSGDIIKVQW